MADLPVGPPGAFIAPSGGGLIAGGIYSEVNYPTSTGYGGQSYFGPTYVYWGMAAPQQQSVAPSNVSAATGVSPTETSYALYGHTIPILVFGQGRVGGDIISGPVLDGGNVYGINSFGVQADPTRILTLVEISLDSEVVWSGTCVGNATAAAIPDPSGFTTEPFTVRFYTGSLDQPADPLETAAYGADAVAYIGQVLLAIDGLPVANTKFKKYPYISGKFVDQDGSAINFGDAFERLAYSPYTALTTNDFETVGITDGVPDGGFIITDQTEFLALIQQYGRFYRSWDILQTDKLRIVDRGSDVTPDIILDKSSLMGRVVLARSSPNSIPRTLTLTTIDPDADYTIVPSTASFPRDPVAVSTSVKAETQYLPMIMDSSTRQALATFTKYSEEISRKKVTFTTTFRGIEIEPGALVGLADLVDGVANETYKVKETTHGANHTVEVIAESFMDCQISTNDPYISDVVLLMGYESGTLFDESPSAHGLAGTSGTGAPAVTTSKSDAGSSSLQLNGTSIAFYPNSNDWNLSTANSDQFTIECSVWFTAIATTKNIIARYTIAGTVSFALQTGNVSSSEFQFAFSTNGTAIQTVTSSGAGLTNGQWYRLAVDKDASGKIRIYRDGVMVGSATPADSSFHNNFQAITIAGNGAGFGELAGYVDEIRITKGAARYASDSGYTTSLPFPRS